MPSTQQIDRATTLLQQGKPTAAAAVLAAFLASEPRHAHAAHLLGLALKEAGDWDQGEQWLRFSIELAPNQGEFHANLGNLLRKRAQYSAAEAAYREALRYLPQHSGARRALAQTLNDLNRPAEARAECLRVLESDKSDGAAWEILALSLGALGLKQRAVRAHRRAIELNPNDAVAHHNLGALLAELGRPGAKGALEVARKLGADGFETAYNSGRVALNEGDLEAAERAFERAVQMRPLEEEPHKALAQVRLMSGDPAFARDLGFAVRANRENVRLQRLLAELLWQTGELPGAEALLRDLTAHGGAAPDVRSMLAMVLLDQGRLTDAETEALDAATANPRDAAVVMSLVTILLVRGRPEEAESFIAGQLERAPGAQEWLACDAIAARMQGKARHRELFDYDRFVRVFDIEPPPGFASIQEFNAALSTKLTDQHRFVRQPLNQTLRNGTQTLRSLLSDSDPMIRAALDAFRAPLEEYRQALEISDVHPLAHVKSGILQYTGAWAVRLGREGFHVNHVHSQGALSSAYYVEVPEESQDPVLQCGWLKFGEPRYPIPGLKPEHKIRPCPGQLVLFPSYLWHGTTPIHGPNPRTSISFDVQPGPG